MRSPSAARRDEPLRSGAPRNASPREAAWLVTGYLIANTVEELLRLNGPAQTSTPRTVVETFE
jgi:cytochrome P450